MATAAVVALGVAVVVLLMVVGTEERRCMHTYTRACCMGGWYGRETRKRNSHKKVTKRAIEKRKRDSTRQKRRTGAWRPFHDCCCHLGSSVFSRPRAAKSPPFSPSVRAPTDQPADSPAGASGERRGSSDLGKPLNPCVFIW